MRAPQRQLVHEIAALSAAVSRLVGTVGSVVPHGGYSGDGIFPCSAYSGTPRCFATIAVRIRRDRRAAM
jgi:hypothetical protein